MRDVEEFLEFKYEVVSNSTCLKMLDFQLYLASAVALEKKNPTEHNGKYMK